MIRYLPRKNIHDINRCIRQVVTGAYNDVAFYRHIFDTTGLSPSTIRSIEDLPLLPVVSRIELMAGGPVSYLRRGSDPNKLTVRQTTGTTGTPVTVYMNFREQAFRKITFLDAYSRNAGTKFPLRLIDVGPERKASADTIVSRFGPHTRVRLFRDIPMEKQLALLFKTRASMIVGRPSIMWELALALKEAGLRPPRPKIIISNVEMLFSHVRVLLEDVFGCPVADYYSCEEVGSLAWQCPAYPDRMHPNPATVWIEIVDPDGQPVSAGKEGRIVVTNLYNHTMPFIRYATGDRGVALGEGKCACGFQGPVMRLTEGRDVNFLVLPDGSEINPRIMYDAFNFAFPHDTPGWNMIDSIRAFQIIQESLDLIVVKVVPGPRYSDSLWPGVRKNLTRIHPALRLEVELVSDLTPEPGKKFHQVYGKLNNRWMRERKEAAPDVGRHHAS
ncbi:MAG: hypothetical protein R6W75_10625 [Smithellaceae bacterium]